MKSDKISMTRVARGHYEYDAGPVGHIEVRRYEYDSPNSGGKKYYWYGTLYAKDGSYRELEGWSGPTKKSCVMEIPSIIRRLSS